MNYKLDSFVNDFSKILDSEYIKNYNKKFYEYEQNNGVQIATVFIKHRKGKALKDIALEIFNKNGIGYKDTNSGLLLVVITDEKKIRIMTGKGMEIEFPDFLARDIIQNELRELLNLGDYKKLLNSWYELSTKKRKVNNIIYGNNINLNKNNINYSNNLNKNKSSLFFIFFFISIVLFFIYIIFLSDNNEKKSGLNYNSDSNYNSDLNHNSDKNNDFNNNSYNNNSSYDSYDSDWGGGTSNGGGWGD